MMNDNKPLPMMQQLKEMGDNLIQFYRAAKAAEAAERWELNDSACGVLMHLGWDGKQNPALFAAYLRTSALLEFEKNNK